MTVMPTAAKRPPRTASHAARTAPPSTFPSISMESWRGSSAAAIVMIDNGKRAWRRAVILGLINSTRPAEAARLPAGVSQRLVALRALMPSPPFALRAAA